MWYTLYCRSRVQFQTKKIKPKLALGFRLIPPMYYSVCIVDRSVRKPIGPPELRKQHCGPHHNDTCNINSAPVFCYSCTLHLLTLIKGGKNTILQAYGHLMVHWFLHWKRPDAHLYRHVLVHKHAHTPYRHNTHWPAHTYSLPWFDFYTDMTWIQLIQDEDQ